MQTKQKSVEIAVYNSEPYAENTFGVRENEGSNRIRVFTDIDKAKIYAVEHFQTEIILLNSNLTITVKEMMIPARAQMLKEMIQ